MAHLTDVQDSDTIWLDGAETLLGMHGRKIGAVYADNMLERLFSRFCVGK